MIASRKKLGDLCNLVTKGTTPTSVGFDFAERGVPFLRIQNISGSTVSLDDVLYIEESTHNALGRSKIRPGDFLITIAGTIGRTAIVPPGFPESNCNQAVAILRFDEAKLWPKFLLYWLSTEDATTQISGRKVTATISNLSLGQIKELEIPLPPLPEQKRIAAILDKADAIRRKRQQAIQLADDFLRAVFLDMFGDPVTNPKGWPKKALKLLGKSATGRTPPSEKTDMWGEGLPFVTPGDLSGRVDSSVREVTQAGAEHSKVCRTGSTLVCCIGTIGKVGIAGCPVAFNQQINAQEWGTEVSDAYGFFVFKLFPELVRERAIQTTLPILKKSLFDEIEIPVPAKDLQEKFAAIAQITTSFSARHESGVEMPIFESLSQLAFSGKL